MSLILSVTINTKNQYSKSDETPSIIYEDIESLIRKGDEKSSTTKIKWTYSLWVFSDQGMHILL